MAYRCILPFSSGRVSGACSGLSMHFWLSVGFFRIQERLAASLSAVVAYRCNPADSLMRFFSPQTRYFNAGLGRTEVYIW